PEPSPRPRSSPQSSPSSSSGHGGWNAYIDSLMDDGTCQDAAIIGYKDSPSLYLVWARPRETFVSITQLRLVSWRQRPVKFFREWVDTWGPEMFCDPDSLLQRMGNLQWISYQEHWRSPTFNVTVTMTAKTLVLLWAKKVSRCLDQQEMFEMASHLRASTVTFSGQVLLTFTWFYTTHSIPSQNTFSDNSN
ncbi:hypothetical protein U0070_020487, partial [Myodes glareolus]